MINGKADNKKHIGKSLLNIIIIFLLLFFWHGIYMGISRELVLCQWWHFGERYAHFSMLTKCLLRHSSGHEWLGPWGGRKVLAIKPHKSGEDHSATSCISWRDVPDNKALEDPILCVECDLTGRGEGSQCTS